MKHVLLCRGCFRWHVLFTPDQASLPMYILAVQFLNVHSKSIDGWEATVISAAEDNSLLKYAEARQVWGDHEPCSFTDNVADSLLHSYCPRCLLCVPCGKCACHAPTFSDART